MPAPVDDRPSVLFVCVHNAGRSQMAAGYLTHLAHDRFQVLSAGSQPADQLNPVAVAAMAEDDIDILPAKAAHPRRRRIRGRRYHHGLRDTCPVFPGKRYEDWALDDPAGQPLDVVRRIRDDIRHRIQALVDDLITPSPQSL